MRRTPLTHLLILALLFISLEGTVNAVGGEHPHGDEHAHHIGSDTGLATDLRVSNTPTDSLNDNLNISFNDTFTNDSHEGEHCQHCCHGHTSSITVHITTYINAQHSPPQFCFFQPTFLSLTQTPPTRPPNV